MAKRLSRLLKDIGDKVTRIGLRVRLERELSEVLLPHEFRLLQPKLRHLLSDLNRLNRICRNTPKPGNLFVWKPVLDQMFNTKSEHNHRNVHNALRFKPTVIQEQAVYGITGYSFKITKDDDDDNPVLTVLVTLSKTLEPMLLVESNGTVIISYDKSQWNNLISQALSAL